MQVVHLLPCFMQPRHHTNFILLTQHQDAYMLTTDSAVSRRVMTEDALSSSVPPKPHQLHIHEHTDGPSPIQRTCTTKTDLAYLGHSRPVYQESATPFKGKTT
jgi:hypothetical protein